MKPATADDWETIPLPEHYITIELDILLSERQSELLKKGFIPDEMEEKWFCYFKQLFHRCR